MKTQNWFLIIALLALGYLFFRGGDDRYSTPRLDYNSMAVSDGLTQQAAALNLEADLDVSLLPDIGRDVIREAAKMGLKEQAFLEYTLKGVSNRVSEISTIDLNEDGNVDPILIKPEPSESEGFVVLSLQVPHTKGYPLPPASDQAAWASVETFEVATMSVSLNADALIVEAQGNQHMYPNQQGQNYTSRDSSPSFLQTYLAISMAQWMFYPRMYGGFMGPGYGYGYYNAAPVNHNAANRSSTISQRGYSSKSGSPSSSIRGKSSGATPSSSYSRAYSKTPPKSMSELKGSRRFVSRPAARTRTASTRYSNPRNSSRGFGRSTSRPKLRGGGMRFGK